MKTADKVIAEWKHQHPERSGRTPELSDEMLALCAVLDRERIRMIQLRPGYADGVNPQPSVRIRGKRESVE
ncbi:hypothetical protein ACYOEI_00265 [Singulisphaera rosea]